VANVAKFQIPATRYMGHCINGTAALPANDATHSHVLQMIEDHQDGVKLTFEDVSPINHDTRNEALELQIVLSLSIEKAK